ncbi:MAG TPA: CapA family protein [Ktedonobacterales bacterium]|nr:CapA family protein [Ktedonobacterales bacterium]
MRLLLVGDVMLGRYVNATLRHEPPEYPWGDTLPVFQAADARLLNLECALADGGEPWSATPKVFHFRSDAKNVATLRAAGVNMVALANNHALDYGYDALDETLRTLDEVGIGHAGAGRDLADARRPAMMRAGKVTVGMLAFTDNEPGWAAEAGRSGVNYAPVDVGDARARALLADVRRAKAGVDALVVSAHWGPNWGYQPPQEHIAFARALVEAGADVVYGHSGHVFRGVEFYQGRPILYCAGDFVDDYMVDEVERNDESGVFALEWEAGETRAVRVYPTIIADCQARLARGSQAEAIGARLRRLCEERGTAAVWDAAERALLLRAGGGL